MIDVGYFAVLKEKAGVDFETVELLSGDTGGSVFERLKAAHDFPLSHTDVRLAVGDEFVDMDTPLNTGDKVVFIPPVAGG